MKKVLNLLVVVGVLISSCSEKKDNKPFDYSFGKKDTSYSPNTLEIREINTTIFLSKDSNFRFYLDSSFMELEFNFNAKSGNITDKYVKLDTPKTQYTIFYYDSTSSGLVDLTKSNVDSMFNIMNLIVNNPSKFLSFDVFRDTEQHYLTIIGDGKGNIRIEIPSLYGKYSFMFANITKNDYIIMKENFEKIKEQTD